MRFCYEDFLKWADIKEMNLSDRKKEMFKSYFNGYMIKKPDKDPNLTLIDTLVLFHKDLDSGILNKNNKREN